MVQKRESRGASNIVGNDVHFIDPPKGNTRAARNESNLPYVKAEFSGRTFLDQIMKRICCSMMFR